MAAVSADNPDVEREVRAFETVRGPSYPATVGSTPTARDSALVFGCDLYLGDAPTLFELISREPLVNLLLRKMGL